MNKADSSPDDNVARSRDIVERTFDFAVRIIQLCGKMDERPGVGRVMMSQILRAGTSVAANVEEACIARASVALAGIPATGHTTSNGGETRVSS